MKRRLRRLRLHIELLGLVLYQIVFSGFYTAWMVIRFDRRPEGVLFELGTDGLDEIGVTGLAALIAIAPGTTPVAIDYASETMVIHCLDRLAVPPNRKFFTEQYATRLAELFPRYPESGSDDAPHVGPSPGPAGQAEGEKASDEVSRG